MSWAIGFDSHWNRDIGYGVPAFCDYPHCNKKIDRGLSYVCGGEPYGGEFGCGLFFCEDHLYFGESRQLCRRCDSGKKPYKPKPDHPTWIKFKMTDASWAEWRKEQAGRAGRGGKGER